MGRHHQKTFEDSNPRSPRHRFSATAPRVNHNIHSDVWDHERNFVFQKICNPQNVSRFGRWLSVYNFWAGKKHGRSKGSFSEDSPQKLALTRFAISKLCSYSCFDVMYVYSCPLSLCILGGSCFTNFSLIASKFGLEPLLMRICQST